MFISNSSAHPVSGVLSVDGDVWSSIWPAVWSGWGAADGGSGGQHPTAPEQDSPSQQSAPIPRRAEGSWECAKPGECHQAFSKKSKSVLTAVHFRLSMEKKMPASGTNETVST